MMAILSSRVIINVRKAVGTGTDDLTTISADPLHFAVNPNGSNSICGWRPETRATGASVEMAHRSVHGHIDRLDTDSIEMNCNGILRLVLLILVLILNKFRESEWQARFRRTTASVSVICTHTDGSQIIKWLDVPG